MALASLAVEVTQEQVDLLRRAISYSKAGHPRLFMESFMSVKAKDGTTLPFKFLPTQVEAYRGTFGSLTGWSQPLEAVIEKSRQVSISTLYRGCDFVFRCTMDGYRSLLMTDSDDRTRLLLESDDFYWSTLPKWVKVLMNLRRGDELAQAGFAWNLDMRHLLWGKPLQETGGVFEPLGNSTLVCVSAGGKNAAIGTNFKFRHFAEVGKYTSSEKKVFADVMASKAPGVWDIYESSVDGKVHADTEEPKYFWVKSQEAKRGETDVKRIPLYWYKNPAYAYDKDSLEALPADRRSPLEYTNSELALIQRFRQDGILDEAEHERKIRFRRKEVKSYTATQNGDAKRGEAIFIKEYFEDDELAWVDIGLSRFDLDIMGQMAADAARVRPIFEANISGMRVRKWKLPHQTGSYVSGMDIGAGRGGDSTIFYVMEQRTGIVVASAESDQTPVYTAVKIALELLSEYNQGIFCWENNGPGAAVERIAVEIRRTIQEKPPRLFRRRPKMREDISSKAFMDRPYGWDTTGQSKERLFLELQASVNARDIWAYSPELVSALQAYDPESKKHTSDRVMALAIANVCRLDTPLPMVARAPETIRERRKRYWGTIPHPVAPHVWGG